MCWYDRCRNKIEINAKLIVYASVYVKNLARNVKIFDMHMRMGPITSRISGENVILMVTTHIDTRHMVYKYMESLKSGVVVYSELCMDAVGIT